VDVLTWIIVGLVAGLLASLVMGGVGYGILGDIVLASSARSLEGGSSPGWGGERRSPAWQARSSSRSSGP